MTLDADDFKALEALFQDLLCQIRQGRETQLDTAYLATLPKAEYDKIMKPRMAKAKKLTGGSK